MFRGTGGNGGNGLFRTQAMYLARLPDDVLDKAENLETIEDTTLFRDWFLLRVCRRFRLSEDSSKC